VAVLGLDDLSLVLLDFRSCRLHHCHVDDVIATINAVRLVPTDERADLLWDALSGHVVDTSPSHIVKVEFEVFRVFLRVAHRTLSAFAYDLFALSALKPATSRPNASVPPRIPEVLHRTSVVPRKHKISRLLARGTPQEDFEHVLGHHDHALITVLRFSKIDNFRQ